MFQRILIPTDGSTIAHKAVNAGIEFAKEVGASVIAYYAAESIERLYLEKGPGSRPLTVGPLEKLLRAQGEQYLAEICKVAEAAGVACETVMTSPATPSRGSSTLHARRNAT